MDNPSSELGLNLPVVPDDFNGGAGVDFARALVEFLKSTTVAGATSDATPFDAAAIQSRIEAVETRLDNQLRGERTVLMNGVNNGEIVVPFQDIGTAIYNVKYELVIDPGENPPVVLVGVVDGSKTSSQCKVRIDGAGSALKFLFTITQIREGTAVAV